MDQMSAATNFDGTNIIDEIEWRGLINQSTDLDALRSATREPITLYLSLIHI